MKPNPNPNSMTAYGQSTSRPTPGKKMPRVMMAKWVPGKPRDSNRITSGMAAIGKKIPGRKNAGKNITRKESASAAGWVRMNTPIIVPMLRMANRKIADNRKNRMKLPWKGMRKVTIAMAGMMMTFTT